MKTVAVPLVIRKVLPHEKAVLEQIQELISPYAEKGLMIHQNRTSLTSLAERGILLIAINDQNIVVASAGITMIYPDGSMEFGAWAVREQYQNHQIGKSILAHVLDLAREKNDQAFIFALANNHSGAIFERLGAVPVNEDLVHSHVFIPCESCKCEKKELPPGRRCADTIYNMQPI